MKSPQCNVVALLMQIAGIFGAFIALTVFGEPESLVGLVYAIPTYCVFSLFGLIAACISLKRKERWPALSRLTFFVNVISFLGTAYLIALKVG